LTGGYDFTKLSVVLGEGDTAATLNYGMFISAVINFLLIALVIFCVIKAINKMKDKVAKKEEADPTTKICPFCKSEINIEATRCPHCTSELDK
ncbi:MAG: MscL family protein, partial [Lachnospiraceae bacterium]|nr:MscL family protein [Lachnospiraceae bacterium]